MSARRRLRRLSWGLAILFLVAVVVFYRYRTSQSPEWFDWNAFAETFRGMDKSSLAFALLAISATYILRSLRWQQYTLPIGRTRMKNLLVAHIIGYTGVFLLGRPAEVVRPLLIARKENLRISSMLGVVLFERVQDVLAVLFWMGFGLLVLPAETVSTPRGSALLSATREAGWLALAAAVFAMALLGLWKWHSERILGWIERIFRFLPHAIHQRASDLLRSFSTGWKAIENIKILLTTFGYSLLIWYLVIVAHYLICRGAGVETANISFGGATILVALGIVGSVFLIPGIGGGYQAAVFITLTSLFGVGVEAAAGLSVLLWLIAFAAITVIGVPLMIQQGLSFGELRSMSRKREETPAS